MPLYTWSEFPGVKVSDQNIVLETDEISGERYFKVDIHVKDTGSFKVVNQGSANEKSPNDGDVVSTFDPQMSTEQEKSTPITEPLKWDDQPIYKVDTKVVGGTIDPSKQAAGGETVNTGYTPNPGYVLKSVTVDGVSVPIETYTKLYSFPNIDKDHVIEVEYGAPTYTVRYLDSMDTTKELSESKTVEAGQLVPKPSPDPEKEGYTFAGWYKEQTCQNPWNFDTEVMPEKDLYLYAKWTKVKDPHTVTYNANGHGTNPESKSVESGDKVPNPGQIKGVEGYTHDGNWYKDPECTQPWDFTKDTMPDKDITLYAKWNTNQHRVNYHANGHGEDPDPKTVSVYYGDKVPNPGKLEAEGFVHEGDWYLESECKTQWNFDKNTMPDKDLDLYAKWLSKYSVKVTPSDHGTVTANPSSELKKGDTVTLSVVPDEGYVLDTLTVTNIATGEPVAVSDNKFTMPAGDVNVVAKFKGKPHTVTFDPNGHGEAPSSQTVSYGSLVNNPGTITGVEGYTHDGNWYKDPECTQPWDFTKDSMPDKDITLYAKWNTNQHRVNYHANGHGVDPATKTVDYGAKVPNPGKLEAEGFVHEGDWYLEPECKTQWNFDKNTMPDKDLDLYAKWLSVYSVKFVDAADTATVYGQSEVVEGNKIERPKDPTKDGYTFEGWYSDKELKNLYDFDSVPKSDTILYAKFVKKDVPGDSTNPPIVTIGETAITADNFGLFTTVCILFGVALVYYVRKILQVVASRK